MPGVLSKYRAGSSPIGSFQLMAEHLNLATLADSSEWLRAGSFLSRVGYERAAELEHLKAIAFSPLSPAANFAGPPSRIATNGAGTILILAGTTSLWRSTDNGATWAAVGTWPSGNPSELYFLNGKFWILTSDSGSFSAHESVTGASGSWTSRLIAATGSPTANSARMDWTGTNFVFIIGNNSNAYTSPTGVTWTPRALGFTPDVNTRIAAAASGGAVVVTNSANARVSMDHGVTWATVTSPWNGQGGTNVFTAGNRFYVIAGSNAPYVFTATDPSAAANWSPVSLPGSGHSTSNFDMPAGKVYRNVARNAAYSHTDSVSNFRTELFQFNADGTIKKRHSNIQDGQPSVLMVENGVVFAARTSTAGHYRVETDFEGNAIAAGSRSLRATNFEANIYARIK